QQTIAAAAAAPVFIRHPPRSFERARSSPICEGEIVAKSVPPMRIALLLLAIGCLGGAIYEALVVKNSYSSYSGEQLDQLEAGFRPAIQRGDDDNFSMSLLEDERRRRLLAPSLGIASVVLVGLFFVVAKFAPPPSPKLSEEDARLKAR